MTDKDKEYFKMLKERDTAKPCIKYQPSTEGIEPWGICPVCGFSILSKYAQFCSECGQRLDRENWAL